MDEDVMKMRSQALICGSIAGLIILMSAARADEVWVQQARGRISGSAAVAEDNKPAKTAPENSSATAAAVTGSPTTPATCNQQNASSPACYSATQQTRGR